MTEIQNTIAAIELLNSKRKELYKEMDMNEITQILFRAANHLNNSIRKQLMN